MSYALSVSVSSSLVLDTINNMTSSSVVQLFNTFSPSNAVTILSAQGTPTRSITEGI